MSSLRSKQLIRTIARVITAATIVAFAVTAISHERARAATVSLGVTCSGSWTVYDVTAAQGDTVEVTIDSGCYNVSDSTAYGWTPVGLRSTYFSSEPSGLTITSPTNKITWVVKNSAPVGVMPGSSVADLPYVCNNCSQGVAIRFTIAAAGGAPTTAAPTTTLPGGGGSDGSGEPEDLSDSGVDALTLTALATALLSTGLALRRRTRPA